MRHSDQSSLRKLCLLECHQAITGLRKLCLQDNSDKTSLRKLRLRKCHQAITGLRKPCLRNNSDDTESINESLFQCKWGQGTLGLKTLTLPGRGRRRGLPRVPPVGPKTGRVQQTQQKARSREGPKNS